MSKNVNFEFLDTEAIENAITCLNYKVDKVVFFGYEETIHEKQKGLNRFLKERCGVEKVQFLPISHTDLDEVIRVMKEAIHREYSEGNRCFFDITGGEGLALLAFGILSREMKVPMHLFDVQTGELREFCQDSAMAISKNVEERKVPWNLEVFVEMQGGIVDYKRGKHHKVNHEEEDLKDILSLWELCKEYQNDWNSFSGILAKLNKYAKGLTYQGVTAGVRKIVNKYQGFGKNKDNKDEEELEAKETNAAEEREPYELFDEMLDACVERGFLTEALHNERGYTITYKNEFIMSCLGEAGCALEQRVFLLEKDKTGVIDCRTGVHIDWDGEIMGAVDVDVLNEIDVVVLKGYIPTFISCKAGKTSKLKQDVLYELDAVTSRFGGKYAKKELALMEAWSKGHLNRARDMEIKVRVIE